jgi:preprotein translocase subunit Sss1
MYEDFIRRLKDPRIQRPLIGLAASYLSWGVLTWVAVRTGLTTGTENERWIAVTMMMTPLVGMVGFLVHLYSQGDEVERAMQLAAASTGFVVMMLVGMLGLIVDEMGLPFQLSAIHIFSAGMLAWLIALWQSFRYYQ